MRPSPSIFLVALILGLAACSAGSSNAGWRGPAVHLVDGTWIGTETECARGDEGLECRTVIARALALLAPDVTRAVKKTALATLPTTYVTADGEVRTARLSAGIDSRRAIVIDLDDGSRRVIGLWCHISYSGTPSALDVEALMCSIAPLDYWLDGDAPPSYPPGTNFS